MVAPDPSPRFVTPVETLLATQSMRPIWLRAPEKPTSTENQVSVDHPAPSLRQSDQESTPVLSRMHRPSMAPTAPGSPKPTTQMTTAAARATIITHSSRLRLPISLSLARAEAGASGVSLISGGTADRPRTAR